MIFTLDFEKKIRVTLVVVVVVHCTEHTDTFLVSVGMGLKKGLASPRLWPLASDLGPGDRPVALLSGQGCQVWPGDPDLVGHFCTAIDKKSTVRSMQSTG